MRPFGWSKIVVPRFPNDWPIWTVLYGLDNEYGCILHWIFIKWTEIDVESDFETFSRMKQLHSARTSKMIDFEAKLAHFASDSMRTFVNLSPLGSSVFGRWRIVFYGLQEVLYGFIERRQPNFRLWYFSEPILAVQALTCYQKMRTFVNLSPLGSSVFGRWRIVFYGLQ